MTNIAERRALENAGTRREGVVRGSGFRNGVYNNGVLHRVARAGVV